MTGIGGALIADVLTEICRETLTGGNAWLGNGFQRSLGRLPRSFSAFCADAAANGVWRHAA
jgi:hypothetical protein